MKQATKIKAVGCTAEEYRQMLEKARAIAARNRPGINVIGIKLIGGVWYAVTAAGEIKVSDLSRPTGLDEMSEARAPLKGLPALAALAAIIGAHHASPH